MRNEKREVITIWMVADNKKYSYWIFMFFTMKMEFAYVPQFKRLASGLFEMERAVHWCMIYSYWIHMDYSYIIVHKKGNKYVHVGSKQSAKDLSESNHDCDWEKCNVSWFSVSYFKDWLNFNRCIHCKIIALTLQLSIKVTKNIDVTCNI